MHTTLYPHAMGWGLSLNNFFCYKVHEMLRSAQISPVWHPAPPGGGDGVENQFKKLFLLGIEKSPDLHRVQVRGIEF